MTLTASLTFQDTYKAQLKRSARDAHPYVCVLSHHIKPLILICRCTQMCRMFAEEVELPVTSHTAGFGPYSAELCKKKPTKTRAGKSREEKRKHITNKWRYLTRQQD